MSYEVITGRLVTRTALHMGAGESSATTDALVRRDAQGRLLIPGTALAGVLRGIATRLAPRLGHQPCWALWPRGDDNRPQKKPCCCQVCHLFGDVNPQEQEHAGDASRVWVADALLLSASSETQIRDGVGIDRQHRVAARRGAVKFDLEVLPPGSVFTMRVELHQADQADERLLAAALAEWEQGRGAIGGRANRGLGAFQLQELQRAGRDLHDADTLMAFLKDNEPWQHIQTVNDWLTYQLHEARQAIQPLAAEQQELDVARSWVEVSFLLEADGPFLINDPLAQAQSGFDHAPLVQGLLKPDQHEKPRPVLPGSSLRGALRSQAERIARTLATLEACQSESEPQNSFAVRCPACDPNSRRKRESGSEGVPLESCDSLLRARGLASDAEVHDMELCLACWLFGSARRGSRLLVEDACFVGEQPIYKPRDFLAIDRFTGGGAERYKFDAIELWKPRFAARLRLENPMSWELGWLLLTLRDLQDGLIPLGFGAAKGMGSVGITQWEVRLGFLHQSEIPQGLPAQMTITHSGLYQVVDATWTPGHEPAMWESHAETWIQAFHDRLQRFRRIGRLPEGVPERLPEMWVDTYFGQSIDLTQLYPAEVKTDGAN